jgi:hypothetical protein
VNLIPLSGATRVVLATLLGAVTLVATTTAASANPETIAAGGSNITVSWTTAGGNGSSQATAIVYTVTVSDCDLVPDVNRNVTLNGPTVMNDLGKWFTVDVSCDSGSASAMRYDDDSVAGTPVTTTPSAMAASITFQLLPRVAGFGFAAGVIVEIVPSAGQPPRQIQILAEAFAGSGGGGGGGGGGSSVAAPAPDPTAAVVAVAAEQAGAAGIAGTSGGLLVRGGEVVSMTSSLAAGAGPRGGVMLAAEGFEVTLASAAGARADAGVIVPSGGEVQCSLCGDLTPGSVVEAWVNSDPRLVAAVRVPDDAEAGDCHPLTVPLGAPLDGGGPVEAGAHTLQLRMDTAEGFAVVATGITVGGLTPAGVPAGDGPFPLGTLLLALGLLAASGAVVAVRRQVVAG